MNFILAFEKEGGWEFLKWIDRDDAYDLSDADEVLDKKSKKRKRGNDEEEEEKDEKPAKKKQKADKKESKVIEIGSSDDEEEKKGKNKKKSALSMLYGDVPPPFPLYLFYILSHF